MNPLFLRFLSTLNLNYFKKRSDNINPDHAETLWGYKPETTSFYALNHYRLIGKYHIRVARNQSDNLSLKVFLTLLESTIKCESQMT